VFNRFRIYRLTASRFRCLLVLKNLVPWSIQLIVQFNPITAKKSATIEILQHLTERKWEKASQATKSN
jgi:hypothetical protein